MKKTNGNIRFPDLKQDEIERYVFPNPTEKPKYPIPYKIQITIWYGPNDYRDSDLGRDERNPNSGLERLSNQQAKKPILRIHPQNPAEPVREIPDLTRVQPDPTPKYFDKIRKDNGMVAHGEIDPVSGARVFYTSLAKLPRKGNKQVHGLYSHDEKIIVVAYDSHDPGYVYHHEVGHGVNAKKKDFSERSADNYAIRKTGRNPFRRAA